MANGVELATAYISLVAETSRLKKDINAAFAEADKSSAKAGKKIGDNLSAGLGGTKNSAARAGADAAREYERALKSSLRGEKLGRMIGEPIGKGIGLAIKGGIGLAAVGATAAVGTLVASLTKGFTRLKNIDNAKFKLEALGNSAADVKKIMDAAQKSVKGTAFGLDAAAGTAATAVAAGVAPGSDLAAYLTNVADAAAIAGVSMEEMGSVFNKVQTNGKAMTDDLQMMADRALPIFTWLQKQYGVTGEELQKMVEDGKVSSADFNRAVAANIGGAAQKMGQSFEGAMQNLDAALGRVGATLLGIPFNEASGGIGTITAALDKLNAWLNANQDRLIDFWVSFGDAALITLSVVQNEIGGALKAFGDIVGMFYDLDRLVGALTSWLPGYDDKRANEFSETLRSLRDNLRNTGQSVQDSRGIWDQWRTSLGEWGDRAKDAAQLTKALGDAVATVDNNQILIEDNTPEINKNLEDLGIKLETLPSGDVKLVPNTPEAQQIIDAFLGNNNPTPPVPVPVEPGVAAADQAMSDFVARWSQAIITPSVAPGSGVPGTNPLDVFAGGSSGGGKPTNPLDIFAGGGGGGPGGPVGNMPTGLVTGGGQGADGLFPNAAALKARYGAWGLGEIGGYSANVDQPWDEHQTGTAIDVPIPGGNSGAGTSVVMDALRQPGTKYAIWNQKMWYPDGRVVPMEDRGSPTENHMDHVHARTYDNGGWWPSGTAGINTTGKDEYVLTPEEIEELKKQGIDPAAMQHGLGQGVPVPPGPSPDKLAQLTSMPGATPNQLNGQPQGGDGAELLGGSRTEGYIPAGAGSTAVAGESFMSGIYSMGAEVINGIIDQAASAASSAAGMALTAGTFGAGAAGAPAASAAASAAIGMGTQAAKRGVEYGAQMLGIGTDALIEQLTPFGAPRLLTTDPTGFMPQQALMEAATTSLEKAFQPQQPQGPQQPEQVPAGGVTSQTAEMEPATPGGPQFNTTVNATVKDVNELNRTLNDQQRLNIMQYSGRP